LALEDFTARRLDEEQATLASLFAFSKKGRFSREKAIEEDAAAWDVLF